MELVKGPIGSLVNDLLGTGKVEGLDASDRLDRAISAHVFRRTGPKAERL